MGRTVAEIGRLVGCSSATVSRAINGGSVSPETREAIFKALRDANYDQQPTGRRGRPSGIKTNKNANRVMQQSREAKLVEILYFRDTPIERMSMGEQGLEVEPVGHWSSAQEFAVSSDVSSSFYRRLIEGATAEMAGWGYRAVLQTSTNLTSPESLADVNQADRAGVLLMGQYSPGMDQFINQCSRPLVLVDLVRSGRADAVTTDNTTGIGAAFDHLFALGHRKIGFIGLMQEATAFVERFNAYKWKLAEHDLAYRPEWVYEGPNRIDASEAGAAAILKLPDRPTALLCANDMSALGVLRAAANAGVKVPGDVSVVGFDDDESASLVTPALTTVRTPIAQIGRQAVRQLMLQIQRPTTREMVGAEVRLPPMLIVRQSTAVPAL